MPVAAVALSFVPVALWISIGVGLLVLYRRATAATLFRLAALFLAMWALLATTVLAWVLSHGGWNGVVHLAGAPLVLFEAPSAGIWLEGAVGAFLVFLLAFLVCQAVGRGFLALHPATPLPWPSRLPVPRTLTSLLKFPSERAEAFTFTLLERGGRRGFRRHDVILVSEGLLRRLDDPEREAVVAHEFGHLRDLDGRYLTFFRTLARMMRWDPILAYLADCLTRREEYRADLEAVTLTSHPRALARALYKASRVPGGPTPGGASLLGVGGRRGQRETVERIRRLVALAESGRFPEDTVA